MSRRRRMEIKELIDLKPSQLVRTALSDLNLVEKDPKFGIDMDFWAERRGETCFVCFAGGMLAHSGGANLRDLNRSDTPAALNG